MSTPLAPVKHIDHIVLTCDDVAATAAWYTRYLGMRIETFHSPADGPGVDRTALHFGTQKINLHQRGREFEPKATTALPGTADLCFILEDAADLAAVAKGFEEDGVEPLEGGIVARTGARGAMRSLYVRDPDGNLIELSQYKEQ